MSFAFVCSCVFWVGCASVQKAAAPNQDAEAEAYSQFIAGVILERQGKVEAALEKYQRAADLLPDSYELNRRLLDAYVDNHDLVNAEKTCRRLLAKNEQNVHLWIILGLISQEQGNEEEAAIAFEKALELNPQRRIEYEWLVEAGEKSRDWVTIIQVFEKLVELAPEDPEWHARLALQLSRINDNEGARTHFEKALELDPRRNEIRLQLGLVYLQLDQSEAAVRILREFLEKDPGNERGAEFLAAALARTGDYAGAAERLAAIENARREDPSLHLEYVYTLLRAGQARTAADLDAPEGTPVLSTLFKAIALKAANEPYRPLLDTLDSVESDIDQETSGAFGSMLFLFGEKDAGDYFASTLTALRDEGVNSKHLDITLARVYMTRDQHTEAEAVLAKIVEAHPDDKYPHLYLSTIYDQLDRFRDAERHLKKLLELAPEDPEPMNNLAYLYAERDMRLDEAEKLLKRALELRPNNGYYLDSLGWVYYRRGQADKAIEHIRRAIVAMDHDDAILRDHLGDAYLLKGDVKRAVSEWKRARRLDPKLEGVQEKIDKHSKRLEKDS